MSLIELTYEEMLIATLAAGLRRCRSKTKDWSDAHGYEGDAAWDIEVEGCAAELAYCKYRNVYWEATLDSFKKADVGTNVQVRHTVLDNGRLIVRDDDNNEHFYVLVTGRAPKMKIRGWIKGADAKKETYVNAPNNREPAYFVPQEMLKSFDKEKK